MSNGKTIADIIAEKRLIAAEMEKTLGDQHSYVELLKNDADRIEAAYKREIEDAIAATVRAAAKSASEVYEPHIQSEPVGNAAAMREALKYLRDASREFCHLILNSKHNEVFDKYKYAEVSKIRDAIANAEAALSAPPRNCDVGTVAEQSRRMDAEYCAVQKSCYESPSGRQCPLYQPEVDCRLVWAQMRYKKGGVK